MVHKTEIGSVSRIYDNIRKVLGGESDAKLRNMQVLGGESEAKLRNTHRSKTSFWTTHTKVTE